MTSPKSDTAAKNAHHPRDLQSEFLATLSNPFELLTLFDHLPDVYLYIKDANGRFMKVNRALARLRNVASEDDLIGKTDLDIHPEHWGRKYIEEDRRVMASGVPLPNQVWLVPTSSGQLGWYVSSKTPLMDKQGEVIGIAGVMYSFESAEQIVQPYRELEKVCRYVELHYADSLTISQLAEVAELSVSQLARRFASLFQMSPSQYIQRVRVHHAVRLLSDSHLSAGQIAVACGFYDQAHLTRTFKRWLGQSPNEFRRGRPNRQPIQSQPRDDKRSDR